MKITIQKTKGFLFVVLFALPLLSFTLGDGGKTCKVAGTTGTVEASAYSDGSTIYVDFGNDTDVDVNINFEVRYRGKNEGQSFASAEQTVKRTKRVPPHSSSTMEIKN